MPKNGAKSLCYITKSTMHQVTTMHILTDSSPFSLQASTTNVSTPPATVVGCLESRQLVNIGTVTPVSSSPLKLIVPTK